MWNPIDDPISKGRHKERQALSHLYGAKCALYEAQALLREESREEMADRVRDVFNLAEELFIEQRQRIWGERMAKERVMDAEYGYVGVTRQPWM